MKRCVEKEAAYQSIPSAARITGMSAKWLRLKLKEGAVKYLMNGSEYRINMASLWGYLDSLSNTASMKEM